MDGFCDCPAPAICQMSALDLLHLRMTISMEVFVGIFYC